MPAWDDALDKQLLILIIHLAAPAPPKWDVVANQMGSGFTAEAVRQHYQKLRKKAEQTYGGAPLTPKKSTGKKSDGGTPASGRSKASNKRKKAAAAEESDMTVEDDEADEDQTHVEKKVKVETDADSAEDEV